jgi:UDP-2,4-diacetamido-2,4,6-trideoxy-beta-L-altropyranose hydrolase
MKFVFRTDAALIIGTGHVMRCLTLAKALRKREAKCVFVCRRHEGHLIEMILREGFQCVPLAKSTEIYEEDDFDDAEPAHSSWLGVSWEKDAQESITALGAERFDWLVVDHYALDKKWEQVLRPYVNKIMVIDDLADRDHDCDLLLDQNLVINYATRYQNLLPKYCKKLLGPEYALLQPEYAELHLRAPPRSEIKRILVFFGGSDQYNLSGSAISAFLRLNRDDIVLDVVLGSHNPHYFDTKAQTLKHPNIVVHGQLPSLAPLIMQSDLAIGAGGATTWERCCLGLLTLVITVAENQKSVAEELHKRGLIRWLGHFNAVSEDLLFDKLQAVIRGHQLEDWSRACMSITDGAGVQRILPYLMLNSESKLMARKARLDDLRLLYCLANDPLSCENSINLESVTLKKYQKWFYGRLRDLNHCKIYIIETEDGLPIGQVRFDLIDNGWEINYSITSFATGFYLNRNLLSSAISAFRLGHQGIRRFSRLNSGDLQIQKLLEELFFNKRQSGCKLSITICSDPNSWINSSIPFLLLDLMSAGHSVTWVNSTADLEGGDLCFFLSYSQIVSHQKLAKFRNNLVIHASDLPKGRGWSPASWLILNGESRIPVTLIEACVEVDSGPIYDQIWINLDPTDLVDDWRVKLSKATINLVQSFIYNYPSSLLKERKQHGDASYYPKRVSLDSRLDEGRSLAEQFNLLRIADNKNYPVFFEMHGTEFVLQIHKRTFSNH